MNLFNVKKYAIRTKRSRGIITSRVICPCPLSTITVPCRICFRSVLFMFSFTPTSSPGHCFCCYHQVRPGHAMEEGSVFAGGDERFGDQSELVRLLSGDRFLRQGLRMRVCVSSSHTRHHFTLSGMKWVHQPVSDRRKVTQ